MWELQEFFTANNWYSEQYCHAYEYLDTNTDNVSLRLTMENTRDRRRYNLPSGSEQIGTLIPHNDGVERAVAVRK
jgi:hypothetical protein